MTNAEIAGRLTTLARLMAAEKENPFKVKAYLRAAANIRGLSESLEDLVREEADLTNFPAIGKAIAGAVREIVLTGSLGKLDKLSAEADPALLDIASYPRLDPARVLRVYKKLKIASVTELKEKLERGEIENTLGLRMAQHVGQGLIETQAMLLYKADALCQAIEHFLLEKCKVHRAAVAGDFRRRVEIVDEMVFLVETDDFGAVIAKLERYGGGLPLLESRKNKATFAFPSGIRLRIEKTAPNNWGTALILCTGSASHLEKLKTVTGPLRKPFPAEQDFYRNYHLCFIEPELREGLDEVEQAQRGDLPDLITARDIRGELHAHSTSSDGSNTIEQMARAAQERGYQYIGITDHSQSLKIARGVSVDDLWKQIRFIDRLNAKSDGIRILKSAEVDILADGSLDYPDDLLRALDYTVCSIHSRFGLGKIEQTERIMRAMDHPNFTILGHATGRLLLKRPGYEIDIGRVIQHARQTGCSFEINSSPDRLDLSAEHARLARQAGVGIAINTDAHSTREFGLVKYGIDQARRAGLTRASVLNAQPFSEALFRR